jgi:hypothetical protein
MIFAPLPRPRKEGHFTMREQILRVFLVLEGLLFLAAVYPIATGLWSTTDKGFTMMLSIYFAMGVFLLLAVRAPSEHRSLIAFAGWANIAHGTVMALMAIRMTADRKGLLGATLACVVVGVPLIVLLPKRVSTAGASIESHTSTHAHAG